jgi:hypothetical protein
MSTADARKSVRFRPRQNLRDSQTKYCTVHYSTGAVLLRLYFLSSAASEWPRHARKERRLSLIFSSVESHIVD